jgi:DNA polymerase III epsilon subunit-like protein
MNKVVMIDLETLSLRPNAHILQVGVCGADLDEGKVTWPWMNVWLAPEAQIGRHIDPGTVSWWMLQDADVRRSVFEADPTLTLTVDQLFDFLKQYTEGATVWAKPAAFDFGVLADLFQAKLPWHHRATRCLQTLAATLDPGGKLKPADSAAAHNAGADADWQMQYLLNLLVKRPAEEMA